MKNNFKFFSIVLVLLLASSIVLMGCMYAIAAENGDAKVYDMGSQISADSNIIVDDDTPTSQTELQKKFSAMYDISEDGKTITRRTNRRHSVPQIHLLRRRIPQE